MSAVKIPDLNLRESINSQILAAAIKAVKLYAESHPRPTHVTQKQAAEMMDVSEATVSRMVARGAFRLNKLGRIPITQVDSVLTEAE